MQQFAIRLAVIIRPGEEARRLLPDLQEELNMRPHLLNPRVLWDPDTQRVIVEIIDTDSDYKRSADGMAEEVWEAVAAVMEEFETMRVEVISALPVPD